MQWIGTAVLGALLSAACCSTAVYAKPLRATGDLTGKEIMEKVVRRHDIYPYVYEEQSMILLDSNGNRNIRQVRRFSRLEKDKTVKLLLIFDNPVEIRGVALLAVGSPTGGAENVIYLPAFERLLHVGSGKVQGSPFLGTEFTIGDLTPEILDDYTYHRGDDHVVKETAYFVIDALPKNDEIERTSGYSVRRHFIRQDNYYITRTDYYDRRGLFYKSLTRHDLKQVDEKMWRANMILMENQKGKHKTLIKINRRVFSQDYVPEEIFHFEWLKANRHIKGARQSYSQ